MKNKRAVRVKAVSAGDIREHLAQRVATEISLGRVFPNDAAQQNSERFPDPVRRRHVRRDGTVGG